MNAIALCHNRDLQKTNGRIIVLGSGSISLMQTATWVNMQPSSQSEWVCFHFDYVMVCLSVCLPVCRLRLSPRLCARFLDSCRLHPFIHSLTFPSQAVTLRSTFLPGQPRVQGGWTDPGLAFFPPVSKASGQTSGLFLYSICLPEMGVLLCSLLTVKSWENCPENPEQKGV